MANTLITAGTVVTMDAARRIYADGAVAIADDRIVAVGKTEELQKRYPEQEPIDATGMIVAPGLIDGHNHPAYFLAKGTFDDIAIERRWPERLYPFDSSVSDDEVYWGSLGTFAEMIRSGTTCFADPGGYHPEATIRAAAQIGIRGVITRSTSDIKDPLRPMPDDKLEGPEVTASKTEALHQRWHGAENGRIRIWFGLRNSTTGSDELCLLVKRLADKYGVGIHAHLATYPSENDQVRKRFGCRAVERYERLGILDANFYAVHMGAIDDADVVTVARRATKVAHCPSASMLGGFGCIAGGKFPELIEAGVTVSLGSDAAAISRFLDMTRIMYLAACAHKDARHDAALMGAHKAMEMSTIDGAKALLWDDEIGSLEPGKRADLVLIDTGSLEWQPRPTANPIANLVYSANGRDVDSVMIDGRFVMRGRKLLTIDEEELRRNAVGAADRALARARIPVTSVWPVVR